MEPVVDKLSEDMQKIRREQEELRVEFQALVNKDKDFAPLRDQIKTIDSWFKWISVAAAVLAFLGLNAYYLELPKKIDAAIQKKVDDEVKDARTQVLQKLNEGMENLVYASTDFQKALDEYKSGDIGLSELGKIVKARLQNEIVVSLYADVLLNEREYLSAFELLKTLKERKLIPQEYKRSVIYTNAGCIQLIESSKAETIKLQVELINEARGYLERAVDDAQACYIKTDIRMPLKWLVFVHLSLDQKRLALERARHYKKEGGKRADLVSHTDSQWFKNLVEKHPSIEDNLKSIVADVFAEG
jgi:hypothetical protein